MEFIKHFSPKIRKMKAMTWLKRNFKISAILFLKYSLHVLKIFIPIKIFIFIFDEIYPSKKVETKKGNIFFFCPGRLPLYRAITLLSKEPETIKWIDSFKPNTIFWDIGANVGIYSIYAGLNKEVRVLAFEPAAHNFHIITQNIRINSMAGNISALCIAFNNETTLSSFYMSDTEAGSSHHSFGHPIDQFGDKLNYQFQQSMVAYSIDDFIDRFKIPVPNYIKIDVDGIEQQIILGALNTLKNEKLFSILIELESGNSHFNSTIELLKKNGFLLKGKYSIFYDHKTNKDLANYIFEKSIKMYI